MNPPVCGRASVVLVVATDTESTTKDGGDGDSSSVVRPIGPSHVRVEGLGSPGVFVFPLASMTTTPTISKAVAGSVDQSATPSAPLASTPLESPTACPEGRQFILRRLRRRSLHLCTGASARGSLGDRDTLKGCQRGAEVPVISLEVGGAFCRSQLQGARWGEP